MVETFMKVHSSEPPGDILGFLTGQEEVDLAVSLLQEQGQPLEHCKLLYLCRQQSSCNH